MNLSDFPGYPYCPACDCLHKPGEHRASKQPKKASSSPANVPLSQKPPILTPQVVQKPRRGKQMNQTESRFLARLKDIRAYESIQFEAVKLRIGENCYYSPDFMTTTKTDEGIQITFFEVKGAHIWDDSKVKFKAAKEKYPHWSFEMWQWKGKYWSQIL